MIASTTHIETPSDWGSVNDYDSHKPLLYKTITQLPSEHYIEFGMGDGSTPMLKYFCLGKLTSVENNKEWRDKYIKGYHEVHYGTSHNGISMADKLLYEDECKHRVLIELDAVDMYWGLDITNLSSVWEHERQYVLFIDNAPGEERKILIEKYKDKALVIIVHDTEPGAEYVYGMADILSTFKYRLDYKPEGKPHTTAVSNFINVSQWIQQ